jgi:hypothetical protein
MMVYWLKSVMEKTDHKPQLEDRPAMGKIATIDQALPVSKQRFWHSEEYIPEYSGL